MTLEKLEKMAQQTAAFGVHPSGEYIYSFYTEQLQAFAALVASAEREACEALHDHEDVQAPIGNSSWGEAYQEGWGQGTAAYRDAIKARGQA